MIKNLKRRYPLVLLFAVLILSASGCKKKETNGLIRFIDVLGMDNIVQSPYQQQAEDPGLFKESHQGLFEAAGDGILLDRGAGENPLLLKKKMTIGPVDINALLAPPTSRFRFSVIVPEEAVFEVTYGIRRDILLEQNRVESRDVEFSVVLEQGEDRKIILKKKLTLSRDRDLAFNYKSVDLGLYAGQRIDLALLTRGDEDALACWFNPVIYQRQEDPRNVILISLDTLRPDHLGAYGYFRRTSPAIDRLAEDSTIFLNTFSSAPWTLPSHVSMLTALNCVNHQVYLEEHTMDPAMVTLADYLKSSGYFTTAVTGGGFVSGLYGLNRGFDSYHVQGQVSSPDSVERTADDVLNFIERFRDRNFFLFVHTYQIHNPYWSPPGYAQHFLPEGDTSEKADLAMMGLRHENRFQPLPEDVRQQMIAHYDGEILYTDERLIAPILEKLRSLELYDNTMIVLLSDHGEEFYEHGSWLHTQNVYNESIKVPLIIKFFAGAHAGKRVERYARVVDVGPTILEELGIPYDGGSMDGESLQPLLAPGSERLEERICLSELGAYVLNHHIPKKVAINRDRMKLIVNDRFLPEDLAFFRFQPPGRGEIEVYDLEKDGRELLNRFTSDPELARQLLDHLKKHGLWNKKYSGKKVEVGEKIREQLRALGYIR